MGTIATTSGAQVRAGAEPIGAATSPTYPEKPWWEKAAGRGATSEPPPPPRAYLDAVLTADARARGVSKNRRAIEVLRRGLGQDQVERSRLLDEIRRDRRPVDADVARLIREDRPAERG